MRMLLYEWKKLGSLRVVRVVLAVFLAVNALLCWQETSYVAYMPPAGDVQRVFAMAAASPAEVKQIYEQLTAEEQQRRAWARKNDGQPLPQRHNRYTTSAQYNDIDIFNILFQRIDEIQTYPQALSDVIRRAERNLTEYASLDIGEDTYIYRMQERTIEIYERLRETVQIGMEYPRGWEDAFFHATGDICICIVLLVVASALFTEEHRTGILPLLRVCRHSRAKTAVAKLTALLLLTAAVVLLFSLETFIIVGVRIGYSNPWNALQSLPAFRYCPYRISILTYFFLHILLKILTFSLFSLFTAGVSVFVYQYGIVYLTGIGFWCVNLLLDQLPVYTGDSPWKMLNLCNTAAVNRFFTQYRPCNLFRHAVDYTGVWLGLYVLLLLLFAVVCIVRYAVCARAVRMDRMAAMGERLSDWWKKSSVRRQENKRKSVRVYGQSLWGAELYKILAASRGWIWILVLLAVHVGSTYQQFSTRQTAKDAVYEMYMTQYAGDLHPEKRQAIREERDRIQRILSEKESMRMRSLRKEITETEYNEYLLTYYDAYNRDEVFMEIEKRVAYIDGQKAQGKDAWLVYDTGWNKLFFGDFAWTLYAVILLLFAGIFSMEYDTKTSSGGFAQILRTTARGREGVCTGKCLAAASLSALLSAVWNAVTFIFAQTSCALPSGEAPFASIPAFSDMHPAMSIHAYLAVFWGIRIAAAVLLALLLCVLSCLMQKFLPVLVAATMATLLPSLLGTLGLQQLKVIDFVAYMQAAPMCAGNTILPYAAGITTLCLLGLWRTRRRWCG